MQKRHSAEWADDGSFKQCGNKQSTHAFFLSPPLSLSLSFSLPLTTFLCLQTAMAFISPSFPPSPTLFWVLYARSRGTPRLYGRRVPLKMLLGRLVCDALASFSRNPLHFRRLFPVVALSHQIRIKAPFFKERQIECFACCAHERADSKTRGVQRCCR